MRDSFTQRKSEFSSLCTTMADTMLAFGVNDAFLSEAKINDEDLQTVVEQTVDSAAFMGPPILDEFTLELVSGQMAGMRALTQAPAEIPRQARVFHDHHYLLWLTPMSWREAKHFCESVGGHLATLTTSQEDAWVRSVFPCRWTYWLGGTDEHHEGSWRWITGEPWTYSCWNQHEPNNSSGSEHCLQMHQTGTWNDASGHEVRPFLIEWDH